MSRTANSGSCRDMAEMIVSAARRKILKKCTLSKPSDPAVIRSELDLMMLGGAAAIRVRTFLRDGKAIQKNHEFGTGITDEIEGICEGYSQINLITLTGQCEYRKSKSGKSVILGGSAVLAAAFGDKRAETCETDTVSGNDRRKNRMLDGTEPFLRELGVSSPEGRVLDKKQAKFRQICRFLEYVRDIENELPDEGVLRICDLCCGKSYLSFAVYHYFAEVRGREVSMTCVDLKPDVIAYCSDTARKLGFSGLEFICMDALKYETDAPPQLVVSLHACDIATDIVLHRAADWGAKVILSTPCCHHELAGKIKCEALDFVSQYPMLRRKMCDALTDAVRLSYLKSEGYSVDACELVDPDDTPKNILLRAVKRRNFDKNSNEAVKLREEYVRNMHFLTPEGLWGFSE